MKTRLVAVMLGVLSASFAHAGAYSEVIQVESGGLECAARAARVSTLFVSNASVKKLNRVECVNEFESVASFGPYRVYTIRVEFDADDSFKVPTAEYGTDGMGSRAGSAQGVFPTLDSCLKARPAEMTAFEENVGVSSLFVSCLPEQSDEQNGYVLSIAGFGQAKRQLQALEIARVYGTVDGSLSVTQMEWLNRELSALGATVRMNDGRRVLYYAENPITQGLSSGGAFTEAQHCAAQLSDVQEMLSRASIRGWVECRSYETRTRLEILTAGSEMRSSEVFGQKYFSYDLCMKYKTAVAAREKQKDPQHFLGLVCSPDYASRKFVHTKFIAD